MRAQLGVLIRSVIVCVPSRSKDHIDLDSRLQTLLAQGQALQFIQTELFGGTVDDAVLQEDSAHSAVVDCRLDRASTIVFSRGILQLPLVALLVVEEAGVVISFVEVFEYRGENFGFFVRQFYPFRDALVKLTFESGGEEGRQGEDVLVACEQALVASYDQCDDRTCQGAMRSVRARLSKRKEVIMPSKRWAVHRLLQLQLRGISAKRSLARLRSLARAIPRVERSLEHVEPRGMGCQRASA